MNRWTVIQRRTTKRILLVLWLWLLTHKIVVDAFSVHAAHHGRRCCPAAASPPRSLLLFATSRPTTSDKDSRQNKGRRQRHRSSQSSGRKRNQNEQVSKKKSPPIEQPTYLPAPTITSTSVVAERPSYFTCRHSYESILMEELQQQTPPGTLLSTPLPGMVCMESLSLEASSSSLFLLDPVYALQTLPHAVVVHAESIKGLAHSIDEALLGKQQESPKDGNDIDEGETTQRNLHDLATRLRQAPQGSLAVHALVPGMAKGQGKPVMEGRCRNVAQVLVNDLWKPLYPAARKKRKNTETANNNSKNHNKEAAAWLLQLLLVAPHVVIASLTQCRPLYTNSASYWPSRQHPLGMAQVDMEQRMPSSAYRKLLEAMACWNLSPSSDSICFDLGASPGGWTAALRHFFPTVRVVAVDRSPLDAALMKDPLVTFCQGDAFAFGPKEWAAAGLDIDPQSTTTWMVSDVIAYPDRILDLLESWCGGHWASYLIVTMKFQERVDWKALDQARQVAAKHGYDCRAKHFFNNKNEVTLMIRDINRKDDSSKATGDVVGVAMYKPIS